MATSKVIIIGSGLGSLVSAVLLQRRGYDVTVIERQLHPGGCMQSFQRGAFQWDTGLHYVGGLDEDMPLGQIFRELNLMDLPWIRLDDDAFDRITMPAGQFTFSCGYERFAENLARQFPHQREALHRYATMLKHTATATGGSVLGAPNTHSTPSIPNTPNSPSIPNTPNPSALESLGQGAWPYLEQTFSDPILRQVVSAAAMRLELRRETLPLFTFAHNNAGYIRSAWRLAAPGNALVDKLISELQQAGGRILTHTEVVQITEANGHVNGCITRDGTHHTAQIVIAGTHPAVTMQMAEGCKTIRPSFKRRILRLPNTSGMLTVQLLLRPGMIPYFNRNEYVYTHNDVWDLDTDTSRRGILISCRPSTTDDPYTRQIDILSPMAWDQVAQWADTTIGHRPESYRRFKAKQAQACISLAATVIPHLEEAISDIYISTPLTYRDYNHSPQGSAFGIRKDYHTPLLSFLSPITPLPGLYLNGQSLMVHGIEGTTLTGVSQRL